MTKKKAVNDNTNKGAIKKPRLVLNDATKFYLATHEVVTEDISDLFFFISLFYPVKDGRIFERPQTEITTFDDAESAAIYYETLQRLCAFNAKNPNLIYASEVIKNFKERTK